MFGLAALDARFVPRNYRLERSDDFTRSVSASNNSSRYYKPNTPTLILSGVQERAACGAARPPGDVGQQTQTQPDPVETCDAAGKDQHVHDGRPGHEDEAQQRHDEAKLVERSLPARRLEQPPDEYARGGRERPRW